MSFFIYTYIYREFVTKDALPASALSHSLKEWVNEDFSMCIYTDVQVVKFPLSHLVVGAWYLDCFCGFIPNEEKSLHGSFVSTAPIVLLDDAEEEEV